MCSNCHSAHELAPISPLAVYSLNRSTAAASLTAADAPIAVPAATTGPEQRRRYLTPRPHRRHSVANSAPVTTTRRQLGMRKLRRAFRVGLIVRSVLRQNGGLHESRAIATSRPVLTCTRRSLSITTPKPADWGDIARVVAALDRFCHRRVRLPERSPIAWSELTASWGIVRAATHDARQRVSISQLHRLPMRQASCRFSLLGIRALQEMRRGRVDLAQTKSANDYAKRQTVPAKARI